ncbi:sigma-70 family RNA polymerase sigma factor [Acidovorax sp. Leaf160]|uniref:sigma-70 family RNA polymerase sigma factor n=1 Tax=Acidovorax sp. Leaf160 TaxID=1736280 RepID=UPI000B1DAAFC|nr:sigma-70 family RNA polymerase sigma factor [Acidovorax sp. Leaf160]
MSTPHLLHEFPLHYESLVRFLRRRLGCDEQARDVAHDTWMRLAEHPATDAESIGDARSYFCTVAANLHLDQHRRAQWLQRYLAQSVDTGAGAAHVPDVADGVMYRQALAALDAVLAALPARARTVFEDHRIHGECQGSIAARLDVSLATVERDLAVAGDRVEAALRHWRGDKGVPAAARGRRKSLASLLGLGAVAMMGWKGWRHWQAQALQWQAAFATQRGQRVNQALPDGSLLALDAASRAEVAFDARRRAVLLLQGAAFFQVRAEAARPFVVDAGDVTVTVLGTRFSVELEPAGGVLVQVESGHVRVERGGRVLAAELTAGQGLAVPLGGAAARAISGPVAPWRDGRLHFDAMPLAEAAQRLSRYSRMDLRADARAALLRVSGTVEIAHAHDWLQALPAALPVRLVRESDGSLLLAGR